MFVCSYPKCTLPFQLTATLFRQFLRTESVASTHTVLSPQSASLVEPLSQRELEVLHLISQGLSNREISERLFLALDTVKGHNQRIFSKLQVQRRTEAVSRARELGLV
jgi:ATP/maltotriose-dependent transcriptional regulator MalT